MPSHPRPTISLGSLIVVFVCVTLTTATIAWGMHLGGGWTAWVSDKLQYMTSCRYPPSGIQKGDISSFWVFLNSGCSHKACSCMQCVGQEYKTWTSSTRVPCSLNSVVSKRAARICLLKTDFFNNTWNRIKAGMLVI